MNLNLFRKINPELINVPSVGVTRISSSTIEVHTMAPSRRPTLEQLKLIEKYLEMQRDDSKSNN